MKRSVLALLLFVGCSSLWAEPRVRVAAAANLAVLEQPLRQAFAQSQPGVSLEFVYGASGSLAGQILAGAPFDVFLSADLAFAQKLVDAGVAEGPVVRYARGRLILLSTKPRDFSAGLALLASPEVRQFVTVNPETAPYGRAARQALEQAGLSALLAGKTVTAQTASQAFQWIVTGTGLGFVPLSVLFSPEGQKYNLPGVTFWEIPSEFFAPLDQGLVVLKAAAQRSEVRYFAAWLLSPAAQAVFVARGYRGL